MTNYYILASQSQAVNQTSNNFQATNGHGMKSNNSHTDFYRSTGITPIKSSNNLKGSAGSLQDLLNKKPLPPSFNNLHLLPTGGDSKISAADDVVAFIDLYNFKI